jgi:hypothetical protein
MVAVVAVQVREQEHQWKRERSDNRSNPRPDFEAASSTLANSARKIHRTDRSDRQQREENVAVEGIQMRDALADQDAVLRLIANSYLVGLWSPGERGPGEAP